MHCLRQYLEISTTESAISEHGILPEKLAPVYPNITFINSFSEIYLSFSMACTFFFEYRFLDCLIIILEIKN